MAHDFYKRMHDLHEEFQKKELECLDFEKKWNSAMIKTHQTLPQDYLRKFDERENHIKETYLNVMKQMESFDKHIDSMFKKIEKLRVFQKNIAATECQLWPSNLKGVNSQVFETSQAFDGTRLQLNARTLSTLNENEFQRKNYDSISSVTHPSGATAGSIKTIPTIASHERPFHNVSNLPDSFRIEPSGLNQSVLETGVFTKLNQLSDVSPVTPLVTNSKDSRDKSIINQSIYKSDGGSVAPVASTFNEARHEVGDMAVTSQVASSTAPTHQTSGLLVAALVPSLHESVHQTEDKSVSSKGLNVKEAEQETDPKQRSLSALPAEKSPQKIKSVLNVDASPVKVQLDQNTDKPTLRDFEVSTPTQVTEGGLKKQATSAAINKSHNKDREFDFLESETPKDNEDAQSQASAKKPPSPTEGSDNKANGQGNLKVSELDGSSSPGSAYEPSSALKNILPGSDSDSLSERETPLKASAAYQALLGNIVPQKSSRKISDSDSEDEVEKALAKVVSKGSKKEVPHPEAPTKKPANPVPQTIKSPVKTTPVAAQATKPPSKLSSTTRRVLGLDSSGSEAEVAVTASKGGNVDDSDEFDFFD